MHLLALLLSGLIAASKAQRYPWDDPVNGSQDPDYNSPEGYPWDDYPPITQTTEITTVIITTADTEPEVPTALPSPNPEIPNTLTVAGTATTVITSTTQVTRSGDIPSSETTMPFLTTIITTSLLTTSALLPITTAQFPEAIEGMPDCDVSNYHH